MITFSTLKEIPDSKIFFPSRSHHATNRTTKPLSRWINPLALSISFKLKKPSTVFYIHEKKMMQPMDIEERRPLHASARASYNDHPPPRESVYIFRLRCLLYMTISLAGLHYLKFFGACLRSPNIRREWFKVGLASTIGT